MISTFLDTSIKQFQYYKLLADKSILQIAEDKIWWQYNTDSNSIAIIMQHLSGNMLSRWTDFLTTDGEKEWRNRDTEFESNSYSKQELIAFWEKGWNQLFDTLQSLKSEDLGAIIYIRNQGHTVQEAILRQLAHYPYHVGQIVFIAKLCSDKWESLSIPKNSSTIYNEEKFAEPKVIKHFTDEILKTKE
jgi:Protein of unknown function (DUF1572)